VFSPLTAHTPLPGVSAQTSDVAGPQPSPVIHPMCSQQIVAEKPLKRNELPNHSGGSENGGTPNQSKSSTSIGISILNPPLLRKPENELKKKQTECPTQQLCSWSSAVRTLAQADITPRFN